MQAADPAGGRLHAGKRRLRSAVSELQLERASAERRRAAAHAQDAAARRVLDALMLKHELERTLQRSTESRSDVSGEVAAVMAEAVKLLEC